MFSLALPESTQMSGASPTPVDNQSALQQSQQRQDQPAKQDKPSATDLSESTPSGWKQWKQCIAGATGEADFWIRIGFILGQFGPSNAAVSLGLNPVPRAATATVLTTVDPSIRDSAANLTPQTAPLTSPIYLQNPLRWPSEDGKTGRCGMSRSASSWLKLAASQGYYDCVGQHNLAGVLRRMFGGFKDDLSQVHRFTAAIEAEGVKLGLTWDDPTKVNRFETDQSSVFHRLVYKSKLWDEWCTTYLRFVREEVLPLFDEKEFAVQASPTFRVQMPDLTALGENKHIVQDQPASIANDSKIGWHCDAQYAHPEGEINFVYALTDMFGTNTLWRETAPNNSDYQPVSMAAGSFFHFYGNQCHHFNYRNKTGQTRISIDFRIIPISKYTPQTNLSSLTRHSKFVIGDYFTRIKL
jgi:hypothetical protein